MLFLISFLISAVFCGPQDPFPEHLRNFSSSAAYKDYREFFDNSNLTIAEFREREIEWAKKYGAEAEVSANHEQQNTQNYESRSYMAYLINQLQDKRIELDAVLGSNNQTIQQRDEVTASIKASATPQVRKTLAFIQSQVRQMVREAHNNHIEEQNVDAAAEAK